MFNYSVEVKDPLKQGLKHSITIIIHRCRLQNVIVEVKDPLKQGLKQTIGI